MAKLMVMGTERPTDGFPGIKGTLVLMPIAPPIDLEGGFRCMPAVDVAHYRRLLHPAPPPPGFAPVVPPDLDSVPADITGSQRLGNVVVWRGSPTSETFVLQYVDDDGETVLAAGFDANGAFVFVVRGQPVTMADMAPVAGLEGQIVLRWEPEHISIEYNAIDAPGAAPVSNTVRSFPVN